ncbi:MAG: hypothetical protein RBG13Loki_0652 [Promethearchaeota archaeon CR_4]|nr:MAG: hypothetical protein RBG13Loki_0652 [Candidatus Lokiarchaeota archaeon CR_4]
MSPAITSVVNLHALEMEELKKNVTNCLLQAILVKLEEIGSTLEKGLGALQHLSPPTR